MKKCLPVFATLLTMVSCNATSPTQSEATGKVAWGRDLDAALASSQQTGKPVFALFQEVPGCAGCRQFGRDVLSYPLLVEAIESEFTPLLIHNNAAGKDADVLRRFGEPAWNYQVVRFLDANAKDLLPRKEQVWETGPLAERMCAALEKAGRQVPDYLQLLRSEHSPKLKQAVFAMYCFWTGEMELGKINGVVTTEAGFMNGAEVTMVCYDPDVIALPNLIKAAEKVRCANAVYVQQSELESAHAARLKIGVVAGYRAAPAGDQKKQLGGTVAETLSLTGAQATKVNAWIREDADKAAMHLSPRQRMMLK